MYIRILDPELCSNFYIQTQKVEEELSGLDIGTNGSDVEDHASQSEEEDVSAMEEEDQEDQEWGGIRGDKDSDAHQPGTKPKKPPTGEELRVIKDATDLFRSSSFKLQVRSSLEFPTERIMNLNPDRCIAAERSTQSFEDAPP